jgi:hypothetical protein
MDSVSEEDMATNPTLIALEDMMYSGDPVENATNFKERGNEEFQVGSKQAYRDAVIFYTKGTAARHLPPCLHVL